MKLSVITINRDNRTGLERTLHTIAEQTRLPDQTVVIDGGSSDGSIDVIQKYEWPGLVWKSEPDDGIADAFNKGVSFIPDGFILFLNSGDAFSDFEVVERICQEVEDDSVLHVGGVRLVDKQGNVVRTVPSRRTMRKQVLRNYLPHQGMLIPRELFTRYGEYDPSYRLGMDYEWSLRLVKKGIREVDVLPFSIADCEIDGISMTDYAATFAAYHRARMQHRIMSRPVSWLVSAFYTIRRRASLSIRPNHR